MEGVVTMETILTSVGQFFTAALEWVGELMATIAGNPILLLMVVCLSVAGFAFGAVKRLIRL